ncbi:hypothetical protein NGI46_08115 [Peribacillus butanolivorans]|nr:hypothetical protein [Peribacillus butanolivorans]MCO0597432.1 hypothetical protein [Peribacillus butanolivorans]
MEVIEFSNFTPQKEIYREVQNALSEGYSVEQVMKMLAEIMVTISE